MIQPKKRSSCRVRSKALHGHSHLLPDVLISSERLFSLSGSWDSSLGLPNLPDGSLYPSDGRDGKTWLWDLNDGKHSYTFESGDIIHSLCFSPNRYGLCADKRKTSIIFSKNIQFLS